MFFETKMNIKENLFNTGSFYPTNLKRKRFSNFNKNINSEDEDGSDTNDDIDSVSSSSSSIVSTSSGHVNVKRVGHKILVTDENISDTLKNLDNLQIEMDMENQIRSPTSSEDSEEKVMFDLSSDEEAQEVDDTGIVISDVLKTRLKELNNEDNFLSQLKQENRVYNDLDNLQIIPWIPRDDLNQVKNDYQVEEPSDLSNNKLKRKLSQLNRIHIEEVKSNESMSNLSSTPPNKFPHANSLSNFYLVEHEDDFKKFNNLMPKKNTDFSITELDNVQCDKICDEEEMEF